MRHIIILLCLGISGYFFWQYMGNAAQVAVSIFLRRHLHKILLIVSFVLGWFYSQAILGSLKVF